MLVLPIIYSCILHQKCLEEPRLKPLNISQVLGNTKLTFCKKLNPAMYNLLLLEIEWILKEKCRLYSCVNKQEITNVKSL